MRDNNFFDMGKFEDLMIYSKANNKDEYLFLDGKLIDLDVYLNRPAYFDYPNHPSKHLPCCYFIVLSYAQDLFA